MPRSARFTTTHDLLKKQALALFLEKGYEQTSIQEITERARVSGRFLLPAFSMQGGDFCRDLGRICGKEYP